MNFVYNVHKQKTKQKKIKKLKAAETRYNLKTETRWRLIYLFVIRWMINGTTRSA